MGLMTNIHAVESAQALTMARAISIAFGDTQGFAGAVYSMTGNDRLAQKLDIEARMMQGLRHG